MTSAPRPAFGENVGWRPDLGAASVPGILAGWRQALQGGRDADTPIGAAARS